MYSDQAQRDFARRLRNGSTDAEKRLWYFLRAETLRGHKFRRQAAIGPYIVDFVCLSAKLIVELDGPQQLEPDAIEHDSRRTDWLASRAFRLIRFRNQELDENIHAVVDAIGSALAQLENPPPQPSPPRGGSRKNVRVLFEGVVNVPRMVFHFNVSANEGGARDNPDKITSRPRTPKDFMSVGADKRRSDTQRADCDNYRNPTAPASPAN